MIIRKMKRLQLALPHEHGAWMMWLAPLAVGLAGTPWHLSKPLLAGAVLFAYLTSYCLLQALRHRREAAFWLRWAFGYGLAAAVFGVPVLWMRPLLLAVGGVALLGFAVNAWFAHPSQRAASHQRPGGDGWAESGGGGRVRGWHGTMGCGGMGTLGAEPALLLRNRITRQVGDSRAQQPADEMGSGVLRAGDTGCVVGNRATPAGGGISARRRTHAGYSTESPPQGDSAGDGGNRLLVVVYGLADCVDAAHWLTKHPLFPHNEEVIFHAGG